MRDRLAAKLSRNSAPVARKGTTPSIAHEPEAPTIALALGGGGARGLAHILMLEAFDELGIKPKIIAGTSIGAIFGAAYASGLSARAIRRHTEFVLSQRLGLVRELFNTRAQPLQRLFSLFAGRSALLEPTALLDLILPEGIAANFSDLAIPLKVVASDFYDQDAKIIAHGPLKQAVAASMALPVIFQPVMIDNRAHIDGGLTNPLPFDLLAGEADIVVAVDVSGAPVPDAARSHPSAFEALFASAFLFERSIVREKLKSSEPDILISAGTSQFQVLDFLKHAEILAAAEPAKQRLKTHLARLLFIETLPEIEMEAARVSAGVTTHLPKKKKRRGLLASARRSRAT
ncbi:MAG: patatin-like phospholipase family protein [Hyphomicrobium sp.]